MATMEKQIAIKLLDVIIEDVDHFPEIFSYKDAPAMSKALSLSYKVRLRAIRRYIEECGDTNSSPDQ